MTRNRRAVVKLVLLTLTAALLTAGPRSGSAAGAPLDAGAGQKPTIVLVHGAWADSSSWNAVVQRLTDHGYTSIAPANPLPHLGFARFLSRHDR